MSLEGILVGLLAVVIGAAWATYGLKLFAILLPLWAFFFGLVAGAQWGSDIFVQGFFSTVLSWGIGLVFGLVLAAICYFWYYAAVVIAGGALGYMLAVGIFEFFGVTDPGFFVIVIGLIAGAIFAIGTFALGVPILLVMVFSALSGAAAVVNGVLIIFNQVPLATMDGGVFLTLFKSGWIATIAWVVLAAAGLAYQMRDVGTSITSIDRSAYRYS